MSPAPGGYVVGIDLGTSNTVAVIRSPDGRRRPVLFDGAPLMPSAVFMQDNGQLAVGRDAQRLAQLDPGRYEPNPKRRIDEPSVLLGDIEVPTVQLLASVLRAAAAGVSEITRFPPPVVLTYPASWGHTRRQLLHDAAVAAGWPRVSLIPEPVAAARYFISALNHPLPRGSAMAVYDFGGGTIDIAVVRNEEQGFTVIGSGGLEDVGGLDIDAALVDLLGEVLRRSEPDVWRRLQQPMTSQDRRDRRLFWEDIRGAKEMLSRTTVAPVTIPGVEAALHLTREELERRIGPMISRTVAETARVVRACNLQADQLSGIMLVGGSSRVPLVARMLHRELNVVPTVLEQPELPVAEGAVVHPSELTTDGRLGTTGMVSSPFDGGYTPSSGYPVSGVPATGMPFQGPSGPTFGSGYTTPPQTGQGNAGQGGYATPPGTGYSTEATPAPSVPAQASAAPASAPPSAPGTDETGTDRPVSGVPLWGTQTFRSVTPQDVAPPASGPSSPSGYVSPSHSNIPDQTAAPSVSGPPAASAPGGEPAYGFPSTGPVYGTPTSGAPVASGPTSAPPVYGTGAQGPGTSAYTAPPVHGSPGTGAPTSGAPASTGPGSSGPSVYGAPISDRPGTGPAAFTPPAVYGTPAAGQTSAPPVYGTPAESATSAPPVYGTPATGQTSAPPVYGTPAAGQTSAPPLYGTPRPAPPSSAPVSSAAASVAPVSGMPMSGFPVSAPPDAGPVSAPVSPAAGLASAPVSPAAGQPDGGPAGPQPVAAHGAAAPVLTPPRPAVEAPPEPGRSRRGVLIAGVVAVALLIGAGVWALSAFKDKGGDDVATPPSPIGKWEQLPPVPTESKGVKVGIEGAGAAVFGGKLYVIGGFTAVEPRVVLDSVWTYDLSQGLTGTWEQGTPLPQAMSHMNVVYNPSADAVFVLGGLTAKGATDQVLQLSADGKAWDLKTPLPAPRNSGAAVYDGTGIIYAGGTQPGGEATDTIWALNAAGDAWTVLGKLSKPREKLAALSDGTGTVLFVGGVYQKGGNVTYDDVDQLTQRKVVSTDVKLDHPREGASAVKIEGVGLCVLGGNNGHTEVYDWWCQDSSKTPLLPKLATPRAGMALATSGGSIYVVGGYNGPKSLNGTNTVEVFKPSP